MGPIRLRLGALNAYIVVVAVAVVANRAPVGADPTDNNSTDDAGAAMMDADFDDLISLGNITEIPISLDEGMLDSDTNHTTIYNEDETSTEDDVAGADEETSRTIITPPFAACEPETVTISLRQSDDLSLYYLPSCTRIQRCGGCCGNSEALVCQPVEIEKLYFKIGVKKYLGKRKWRTLAPKIITVDRHIKCECGCLIKETDCTPLQEYNTAECLCKCTNTDEKKKCDADKVNKKWDHDSCACKCKNDPICSSGMVFNNSTCSCEEERLSLRRPYQ